MSAEILSSPPPSGDFEEKSFGEHFSYSVWVKFTDNNLQDWTGCFSKLYDSGLNKVLVDDTNTTAFVVAGGQGYLIDILNRTATVILDSPPPIESAIKTANPDYFVAGACYSFYILDKNGLKEEVRPDYAIDGIYLKGQRDKKAIGELATAYNQYEKNVDFELDLETYQLKVKGESSVITNR